MVLREIVTASPLAKRDLVAKRDLAKKEGADEHCGKNAKRRKIVLTK